MRKSTQPGQNRELEGGTVEFPPHLDVIFDWGTVIDEEASTIVVVNQEIVVMIADEPVRLVAIMGIVRNPASWEVVLRLCGSEVFEEGVQCVLRDRPERLEVETDSSSLEPLRPIWKDLLAAGRDGTLKVLPRRPTDREDEFFDLVTSDPNFFSNGMRILRELYGDEAVDRTLPDMPSG